MGQTFLEGIRVLKVRHLANIEIPLSGERVKHVILTGKNGSGKTSVLDALARHFQFVVSGVYNTQAEIEHLIDIYAANVEEARQKGKDVVAEKEKLDRCKIQLLQWAEGAIGLYDYSALREKYFAGDFILAYYKADRMTSVEISDTIEKVSLQDSYSMEETPGKKLVKYMVSMKATGAMAGQEGKAERAKEIEDWFRRFENILKRVFHDEELRLQFDIESFAFSILESGHEPFNFNEMSSGYSAVFDIINDLIMRSEKRGRNIEGIVLIDEIETHLHLELQRTILPMLTELFPKIQFIVSTHSPFILSSLEDVVIYDLEKGTLVENGLCGYPYEGIVEGYFHADRLSVELSERFQRYKELAAKKNLTDAECVEILDLQMALDEIPDYLVPDIAAEYSQMKLELESRG